MEPRLKTWLRLRLWYTMFSSEGRALVERSLGLTSRPNTASTE